MRVSVFVLLVLACLLTFLKHCCAQLSAPCAREAMPTLEPAPKRSKFSLEKCPRPSDKGRLPDLTKLTQEVKTLPAPPIVREKLEGSSLFVGIDIETHALVPRVAGKSFWRAGEFGLPTTADDDTLAFLRMIQLGWAYVPIGSSAPCVKSFLIKPDGFTVEASASYKHGITHELVVEPGKELGGVLREFMADLTALSGMGYRVCAHHLGFDAGVILREMRRAGLSDSIAPLEQMFRDGLCTMDPAICHWVRQQIGIGDKPRSIPMRLQDLVKFLLPDQSHLIAESHDAGADSLMHLLLAREIHRRALA